MSARLFVALEIGPEDRVALSSWARQAVGADRGMRVVDLEQVHLTLAFLGHRSPDEIPELGRGGRRVRRPARAGAALRRGAVAVAAAPARADRGGRGPLRRAGRAARRAVDRAGGARPRARAPGLPAAPDGRAGAARLDGADRRAAAGAAARPDGRVGRAHAVVAGRRPGPLRAAGTWRFLRGFVTFAR